MDISENSAFKGTILNAQLRFGESADKNADTLLLKEIKTEIRNVGKILKNVVSIPITNKTQQSFNTINGGSIGGNSSSERLDEENRKSIISQKVDFTTAMAGAIGGNSSSERLDELLQDNASRNGLLDKLLGSVDDVTTTIALTSQAIIQAIENIKCCGEAGPTIPIPIVAPAAKATKPAAQSAAKAALSFIRRHPVIAAGTAVVAGATAYGLVDDIKDSMRTTREKFDNPEGTAPANKEKIGFDPNYSPYAQTKSETPILTEPTPILPSTGVPPDNVGSRSPEERKANYDNMYKDAFPLPPITPWARPPFKYTKKKQEPQSIEAIPVPPMADAPPPMAPVEPVRVSPLDNSEKIKQYKIDLAREEKKLNQMSNTNDETLEDLSMIGEEVGTPVYVTAEMEQLDKGAADLQEQLDNTEEVVQQDVSGIRIRDQRILDFHDKWSAALEGARTPKEKKEIYKQMMAAKAKLNLELAGERISGNLHDAVVSNSTMIRNDAARHKLTQKKLPKKKPAPLKDWLPLSKPHKPPEKMKPWSVDGVFSGIKDSMRTNREKFEKNKDIVTPKKAPTKTHSIHYDADYDPYEDIKKAKVKAKRKTSTPFVVGAPKRGSEYDPEERKKFLEWDNRPLTEEEKESVRLNREQYTPGGRLRTEEELKEYRSKIKPKNMTLLNPPIGENVYENSVIAAKSETMKVANNDGGTAIVNAPTTINNAHNHSNIQSPIRNQESTLSNYMRSRYA